MAYIEILNVLKNFNFKKTTVKNVSKIIKINEKTIRKYLKIYNIPYNKKNYDEDKHVRNNKGLYTHKIFTKDLYKKNDKGEHINIVKYLKDKYGNSN